MERALLALRAALLRPAPAWAFWGVASCLAAGFLLAFAAFAFPLSYCDSPSWAPDYLARLVGAETLVSAKQRGLLVPAWFQLWGGLSIAAGFGNLIGLVQAVALSAAAWAVLLRVRRGMTMVELVVLPAFVLSGLRHAIYSQTLLSESLVIPLVIAVALFLLRDGVLSLRQCAVAAALAALAASARIESLLLFPLLLGRIATDRKPLRERVRAIGLALGVGVAALVALAQLSPPVRGEPIGRVMIVAEWMRFSEPPHNALARLLHSDLVERLTAETAARHVRHIYDGLAPARSLVQGSTVPDAFDILRLLAYQLANRPFAVLADRLGTLADLHASGYAAFWPAYRPWSAFYSPYDSVFARWTADDLQQARYSCPGFARAQALHYGRPAIRSESALRLLQVFHEVAEGYARWLLRVLYWAAIPACLYGLARGRGGRPYAWLAGLILASLALRAAFVCADERYQLPLDLLTVAWLMLTLRYSLARSPTPEPSRD
jgi:hypothetical protein